MVTSAQIVRRIALIDGPNVLKVIENKFDHHLTVGEKPDWPQIRRDFSKAQGKIRFDYFINANTIGEGFLAAARWMKSSGGIETRYCEEPIDGFDVKDPVDSAIQAELASLAESVPAHGPVHILLFSHDHGYEPYLKMVLEAGCTVWLCGFGEEMAPSLLALRSKGAVIADLEHDLAAFAVAVPNRPPLSSLRRFKLTSK